MSSSSHNGNGNGNSKHSAEYSDEELNVLRKVAEAARTYADTVIEKRSLQSVRGTLTQRELQSAILDIGTAEFELFDILTAWEKLKYS